MLSVTAYERDEPQRACRRARFMELWRRAAVESRSYRTLDIHAAYETNENIADEKWPTPARDVAVFTIRAFYERLPMLRMSAEMPRRER